MVAGGAGYDDGIHGVVAVVDALFVEVGTQIDRHGGYGVAVRGGVGVVCGVGYYVQSFETREDDAVPHVVKAPVVLEPVGDGPVAGYDVLGGGGVFHVALLVFGTDDVGEQLHHEAADVAAVVHLT